MKTVKLRSSTFNLQTSYNCAKFPRAHGPATVTLFLKVFRKQFLDPLPSDNFKVIIDLPGDSEILIKSIGYVAKEEPIRVKTISPLS